MPLPWKSRSKRSYATDGDTGHIDGGMEPIVEGSHERSVGSSSSTTNGTSTIQLNEELEQLRREIELLKATQSRTVDDSPRTLQLKEQMDQLRMENERLRSASVTHLSPSRLNDQYHIPDGKEPRTPDGRTVEAGEQSMANKYVYETPSSRTGTPDSKTVRSQSLPKPSAPPGASSAHSLVHHPSLQVVREGINHGPSSP